MIIENQQNIKCHFATTEDIGHAISSIAGNVQYGLGSAFSYGKLSMVERCANEK